MIVIQIQMMDILFRGFMFSICLHTTSTLQTGPLSLVYKKGRSPIATSPSLSS